MELEGEILILLHEIHLTESVEHYELIFWVNMSLTETSPVSGASLKKAETFYGYFDIYSHLK